MEKKSEIESISLNDSSAIGKDRYYKAKGVLTFDSKDAITEQTFCNNTKIVEVPGYPSFGEKNNYTRTINKVGIILNPQGGKGRSLVIKDKFVKNLEQKGLNYEIFQSKDLEDYYEIVKTLSIDDFDVIMSCGGDGSIHHFFSALGLRQESELGNNYRVGTIPGGTGNDFCQSAGITSSPTPSDKDLEQYAERVFQGKFRSLDTILVRYVDEKGDTQKRYSPSSFGMALTANSVITAEKYKIFGSQKYQLGALHEILKNVPTVFSVKIDGKDAYEKQEWKLISVCNSQFCGGGLRLTPYAQMDDGLLDVMLLRNTQELGRKRLIDILDKVKKGGIHIYEKDVIYHRCKSIDIYFDGVENMQVDGELFKAKGWVSLKAHRNLLQILT